ncbi:hypothetical protein BDP27DRAFT_1366679 [Rhodocollybia butyracea]|uniref:FHA domain-containing protein n=1 Tax=Rhodocollybia butyracea TaxID=206335 RepID=A0A9P5PJK8_9AGAR|nr:hypothetical protein BDP27DRAFT_1366679 [Rhodocollybia butyracea]
MNNIPFEISPTIRQNIGKQTRELEPESPGILNYRLVMDPASQHARMKEEPKDSGRESRSLRSKFLGSFLGRPVNSLTSDPVDDSLGQQTSLSPNRPAQPLLLLRGRSLGNATCALSKVSALSIELDETSPNTMTRRYVATVSTPRKPVFQRATSAQIASGPFYPHTICVGSPALRIGRYRDIGAYNNYDPRLLKIHFDSKVISRAHAELWLEASSGSDASLAPGAPKLFIRDTRSSTGTFLNGRRLAAAGDESRPFELKDGDLLQLGVDFQGGNEDIHKSVKIRIELELLDGALPPASGVDLTLTDEDEQTQLIAPVIPEEKLNKELLNGIPKESTPSLVTHHLISPVIHEEKSNTGLVGQLDDVPEEATLPTVELPLTRVSEDQQPQPQNPSEAPVTR